jgi:RNA-directed DNA polymerase
MTRKRRRDLRLEECWLFAVSSRADLARRLSTKSFPVTPAEIDLLATDADNFKLFSVNLRNGKARDIQEPKPRLQRIHSRIHKLLSRIEVPHYLHSAVKGKSYLSNARAHQANVAVIKIDVKKFFPSVPRVAIFQFFFEKLKCRKDVAGLLADFLTFRARLPTGSSASPIIAFYAFKPMFDAVAACATAHHLQMTCYVDDMALSGPGANKAVLYKVRGIIARYGLRSHKAHIFAASQPKVVTGVCIASEGQRVPNRLHLKIKEGFDSLATAATPQAKLKIVTPLLGRLEAAGLIDPVFKARATSLRASLRHGRVPQT